MTKLILAGTVVSINKNNGFNDCFVLVVTLIDGTKQIFDIYIDHIDSYEINKSVLVIVQMLSAEIFDDKIHVISSEIERRPRTDGKERII